MPSKKDDYKTGTIVVPDMENYPKLITMEELIRKRTSCIPVLTIKRGYKVYAIKTYSCNDSCGCGWR
jgi:hypothetical protein